jgi:hypothetical protein
MRIGLIAALRRSEDGTALRAALPLAGRSVLAWQAALLRLLAVERVLCLVDVPSSEVIDLQHGLEAQGVQFHALRGFAGLPALVRAEDDLIVLADGLVPDAGLVRALLGGNAAARLSRAVATIPAAHPLAAAHPEDFERIDAARHWAGVLAMRGAPVQQLADFPADADAVALLLRLALQAGTPLRDLAALAPGPEDWLLASDAGAAAQHERALVARAARAADARAPTSALAAAAVRALVRVPGRLGQGGRVAGGLALAALVAGLLAAAAGLAATGLLLAALGAFAAEAARAFGSIAARLRSEDAEPRYGAMLGAVADLMAGGTAWLALAPPPAWQPLAVLGPVVIGLVRHLSRTGLGALAVAASDRAGLLLLLALAAALGVLPETLACLALGLVAALLLHRARD